MDHLKGCPPQCPLKLKTFFVVVTEFVIERKVYRGNPEYKMDK